MPSISRNSDYFSFVLFAGGALSAVAQCVFVREYLAVFSGNELVIGLILCIWLAASGLGSLLGGKALTVNAPRIAFLQLLTASAGIYAIRASRLLFLPGELIGPAAIVAILLLTEAPFSFANGYAFGALSRPRGGVRNPYGVESFGVFIGSLATYACVLLYSKNIAITLVGLAPLVFALRKKAGFLLAALVLIAAFIFLNPASMHWKYSVPFSEIICGREGEIALVKGDNDTTWMLNGLLYKSTAEKSRLEQSVHIPLAQRPDARAVLVIFDRGQRTELSQYQGLDVDCMESEPRIAAPGSVIAAPETFSPQKKYDVILMGSSIPRTTGTCRFYTVSFFKRMQSMMTAQGVFSFTLDFNEDYWSPSEKKLYDILHTTLKTVFKNVLVFPGSGFTFMASDGPLASSWKPRVLTKYLEPMLLPSATAERIAFANKDPSDAEINTADKPVCLALGLRLWLELFRGGAMVHGAVFLLLLAGMVRILPKTREVLSVGSTGFAAGVYCVALLLLYQANYGLLYSRISLLLISLSCGFVAGTLVRRFPHSDLFIGLYCIASLGALSLMTYPPVFLFYCAQMGIGVLGGAQFMTRKNSLPAVLFAADLFGGAIGMALASTILIPILGVAMVAGAAGAIKCGVWVAAGRKNRL